MPQVLLVPVNARRRPSIVCSKIFTHSQLILESKSQCLQNNCLVYKLIRPLGKRDTSSSLFCELRLYLQDNTTQSCVYQDNQVFAFSYNHTAMSELY